MMAGKGAFLAIESEIVHGIVRPQHQRQSIVRNAAVRPSLHQRRNVDHHELVEECLIEKNVGHQLSQGGPVAPGQRALAPTVVELVNQ
jgi:hypothetical protein